MFRKFAAIINEVALIKQIAVGLVIGILLALMYRKRYLLLLSSVTCL